MLSWSAIPPFMHAAPSRTSLQTVGNLLHYYLLLYVLQLLTCMPLPTTYSANICKLLLLLLLTYLCTLPTKDYHAPICKLLLLPNTHLSVSYYFYYYYL